MYAFLPGARGLTGLTSQLCPATFLSQDLFTPLPLFDFFEDAGHASAKEEDEDGVEQVPAEDATSEDEDGVEHVPAEDATKVEEDLGFSGKALVFAGGMPMRNFKRATFCRSALPRMPYVPCMT